MGSGKYATSSPATDLVAVTKSDTVADSNGPFRGILVGVAGIVKLTTAAGTNVTLPSGALAAGVIHPIQFSRVWNSTTTATDVYGVK